MPCPTSTLMPSSVYIENPLSNSRKKQSSSLNGSQDFPDNGRVQRTLPPSYTPSPVFNHTIPFDASDSRSTNFLAVFDENPQDLGLLSKPARTQANQSFGLGEAAERLLRALPERTKADLLLDRYFSVVHVLDPVLHEQSTRGVYMDMYDEMRSPSQSHGPSVGARSFTMSDHVWNSLGIFFGIFGLAAMSLTEWDSTWSLLQYEPGRLQLAAHMLSCADACLQVNLDCQPSLERVKAMYLGLALQALLYSDGNSSSECIRSDSARKLIGPRSCHLDETCKLDLCGH